MGHFFVDCEITHIRNPKKTLKVPHLLVDTGSEYTWIAEETLKQIGISVQKKRRPISHGERSNDYARDWFCDFAGGRV